MLTDLLHDLGLDFAISLNVRHDKLDFLNPDEPGVLRVEDAVQNSLLVDCFANENAAL